MRYTASALCAILIASLPNAALAGYAYTLKIPFNVTSVPAGAAVKVWCMLGQTNLGGEGTSLGFGSSVTVVPPSGQVSGTFTVPATIPWALASYSCNLQIIGPGQTDMINLTGDAWHPAAQPGWTGSMWLRKNCPC
jgi:hypothetical protein